MTATDNTKNKEQEEDFISIPEGFFDTIEADYEQEKDDLESSSSDPYEDIFENIHVDEQQQSTAEIVDIMPVITQQPLGSPFLLDSVNDHGGKNDGVKAISDEDPR
jgi:hypothetical protein